VQLKILYKLITPESESRDLGINSLTFHAVGLAPINRRVKRYLINYLLKLSLIFSGHAI
jgi:hypothetical protein